MRGWRYVSCVSYRSLRALSTILAITPTRFALSFPLHLHILISVLPGLNFRLFQFALSTKSPTLYALHNDLIAVRKALNVCYYDPDLAMSHSAPVIPRSVNFRLLLRSLPPPSRVSSDYLPYPSSAIHPGSAQLCNTRNL